jgi:hypothetical protein
MFQTLLYACFAALASSVLEDCGQGSSIFTLTEFSIYPDPPLLGQPVHLTNIFFNPGNPITDGIVLTDITYNGIPLPQTKKSLCETTACPIQTGSNDRSTETTWPSDASGKIVSITRWYAADGQSELLCLKSSFKVISYSELRGHSLKNFTGIFWFSIIWLTHYRKLSTLLAICSFCS